MFPEKHLCGTSIEIYYLSVFHVIVNGLREVEKVLFERVYYI